ncbi:MAG: sulfite exporter TauE/SafE family protein [Polyangiaceae bacterium]
MLVLAAVLALGIGVTLGLLGGGGSILTLPMLVYVARVGDKSAIAGSLFVVGVTSFAGVVSHARQGNVRWSVGLLFGVAGMVGALGGSAAASVLPGGALLVGFALVMFGTSLSMMRARRDRPEREGAVPTGLALLLGGAVGFVSGLLGAGGGFLVVPALTLVGGLAMRQAIGTSLLVITLQSAAGFGGHLVHHTPVPWALVLVVAGAAIGGSLIGARLGRGVSPARLRGAFAWLVLAMAILMLAKQASLTVAAAALAVALVAARVLTHRKPISTQS